MNNNVAIMYGDLDSIVVSGNTINNVADTSNRFGGYMTQSTAGAATDSYKWTRYFPKGGLYKFRLIYDKGANTGKINIGLDSNATFFVNNLDTYNAGGGNGNVLEAIVSIPRGYHDITIQSNGKHASSNNYFFIIPAILLDLIQENPEGIYQDDRPAQINQGAMVLLGKHKAAKTESTFTFPLADVLDSKYSQVMLVIRGSQSTTCNLLLTIQGLSTTYFAKGISSDGTTVTAVNISGASSWNIMTGSAANDFSGTITLKHANGQIMGESVVGEATGSLKMLSLLQSGAGFPLSTITIATSTSTWTVNTEFELWGLKIQ